MRPPADRDRSLLRADQEQLKMQLRDVWEEMEYERSERDRLERIRESMVRGEGGVPTGVLFSL